MRATTLQTPQLKLQWYQAKFSLSFEVIGSQNDGTALFMSSNYSEKCSINYYHQFYQRFWYRQKPFLSFNCESKMARAKSDIRFSQKKKTIERRTIRVLFKNVSLVQVCTASTIQQSISSYFYTLVHLLECRKRKQSFHNSHTLP